MGCNSSKSEKSSVLQEPLGPDDPKGNNNNNNKATYRCSLLLDPKLVSEIPLEEQYELGEEIGRGNYSIVYQVKQIKTQKIFALKYVAKRFINRKDLPIIAREIEIMKQLDHPNTLKLYEIFETKDSISIILEYISGGELFLKITEREHSFSEKEASNIIKQILKGLEYLHEKGIAHRDLKPENLLCVGDDFDLKIKIADFGLSRMCSDNQKMMTSCGTAAYAAPEVLMAEESYTKAVDLWSLGIIAYILLCGYPPFYAKTQTQLIEKILHGNFTFPHSQWSHISEDAKNLISGLLKVNVDERFQIKDCLSHPFINGEHRGNQSLDIDSLKTYSHNRKNEMQQMQYQ